VWVGITGGSGSTLNTTIGSAYIPGTCTQTGFYRDGVNLTAAVIDPTSPVAGQVGAYPCNVGIYYSPTSSGGTVSADVSGANYYGVVDNASTGAVNVTNATIHNIGESPFNGSQHGVGVFYTTLGGDPAGHNDNVPTGTAATGTLSGSTIKLYQKNGVVVNGPGASATVQSNTVTGQGPVGYIAQNGVEIARGASALVKGNTVSGNWYTGPTYTACGLLFDQAGGVKQQANTLFGNQTNLCNGGRGGGSVSG
jgi:hypothetical protein